ncbi:MAG: hypothetical protein ABIZ36_11535, partial [Gemmatimonadaceae bacterium]
KMAASGIVVDQFQSLTGFSVERGETGKNSPRIAEETRTILRSWLADAATPSSSRPFSAILSADIDGFLALCSSGTRHFLVAHDNGGISLDPSRILHLMRMCKSQEAVNENVRVESVVDLIARHFNGLAVTGAKRQTQSTTSPSRRLALHRIGAIASRSRPHERVRISFLATSARASLLSRMGAYAESRLQALATGRIDDERWMRSVAELGHTKAMDAGTVEVNAILILRRDMKL